MCEALCELNIYLKIKQICFKEICFKEIFRYFCFQHTWCSVNSLSEASNNAPQFAFRVQRKPNPRKSIERIKTRRTSVTNTPGCPLIQRAEEHIPTVVDLIGVSRRITLAQVASIVDISYGSAYCMMTSVTVKFLCGCCSEKQPVQL